MDIDKQIDYWRTSALEDWDAAQALVKVGKYRHGLFLAHMALEKMIKAADPHFSATLISTRWKDVIRTHPQSKSQQQNVGEK